jgi:hypothetical protein
MPLNSLLFQGEHRLEKCLVQDAAHVVPGDVGPHVLLIQDALRAIDGADIDPREIGARRYGPSTANAVLAYKKKRKIINRAYQNTEDNIVGKMTIKSLDDELKEIQGRGNSGGTSRDAVLCDNDMLGDFYPRRRIQRPAEGFTLRELDGKSTVG